MVKTMTMHERNDFEDKVYRLRALINHTPRWYPAEVDGQPVMVESNGEVVLRFEGQWAPSVALLFAHLRYDVGIHLLALLEATPGTNAQEHARKFLVALRLDGRTDPT